MIPEPGIGAASPNDLEDILAVEVAAYADPWPRKAFQDEFAEPCAHVLVGRDGAGRVRGHLVYRHVIDEVQLLNVAVHPGIQRDGWGRALMQHLIQTAEDLEARVILIEVRRSNEPAIGLYRTLGFQDAGVRRGYYRVGREDALLLSRQVSPDQ